MKRISLALLAMLLVACASAQTEPQSFAKKMSSDIDQSIIQNYNVLRPYFNEAYSLYPSVPRGILEAVSYNYTRFNHLKPDLTTLDETCMPATYGVMGLTLDGKGYFRENLRYVADLSGYSIDDIIASARNSILAYAAAYASLQKKMGIFSLQLSDHTPILISLSELPLAKTQQQRYVINSNLYAIFTFLDNESYRAAMGITLPRVQYECCFGDMLPLLRAKRVVLKAEGGAAPESGETSRSSDYAGAVWNPAASCNYSSRNGRTVSAITIHYTQGTYAGSISWFQNCSAQASAHYVLRSSDGQITQMVNENDKAWHVGNCNGYTIGLEHEAYGNIYSYFTPAMYEQSAALTRDICDRHGISPLRMFYRDTLDNGTVLNNGIHDLGGETACTKIRGHQHFPGQTHTDPGKYWNWNYYFKLVNFDTPVTTYQTSNGILTDSGGENADYGNDERKLYLIEVDGAESITLSFSEFELEPDYDFLWIYDGNSVYAPLIGRWNTSSPGTVTSSGNALLVEFRSDCATTAAGWKAQWNANVPHTDLSPTSEIVWDENHWAAADFSVHFNDTDDHGIAYRFFQVMGNDGHRWTANPQEGFYCDNFDDFNTSLWQSYSGNWQVVSHQLQQNATGTSVLASPLRTNANGAYLYDFYAKVNDLGTNNGTAGLFFHCNQLTQGTPRNGYLFQVAPATSTVNIYRILSGSKQLLASAHKATSATTNYYYRIIHDAENGVIKVFRNGSILLETTDRTPFTFNGARFGFITENAEATIDNLRAYRSRADHATIAVNGSENCDACYQANNGAARTKIKSVIVDDAGQFSNLDEKLVKVDYSAPELSGRVFHGECPLALNAAEIPCHTIFCEQSARDVQSGIKGYEYAIDGCDATGQRTRIKGFSESPTITCNKKPFRIASVKVRAVNNAGLRSDYIIAEDATTLSRPISLHSNRALSVFPNPSTDQVSVVFNSDIKEDSPEASTKQLTVKSLLDDKNDTERENLQIRVYDIFGKLIFQQDIENQTTQIQMGDWAAGMYVFQVCSENQLLAWQKVIKQ